MRPCLLQSEPFAAESVGCYQLNRMSVVFGAVLMLSKLCLKSQPSADSLGVSQQPWGSLYGRGRPSNGASACEQAPSPVLLLASVPALSNCLPPRLGRNDWEWPVVSSEPCSTPHAYLHFLFLVILIMVGAFHVLLSQSS